MAKKIKSELMREPLPPEFDLSPPSTLHAKNNGTNITLLSESRAMRLRDHTWNREKEHITRPIQSPALNIRKWTALKSCGLDRGEYEGGLTECTAAVIAGYNASSLVQYRDADHSECIYQRNNVHEHHREVVRHVGLSDLCGGTLAYTSGECDTNLSWVDGKDRLDLS